MEHLIKLVFHWYLASLNTRRKQSAENGTFRLGSVVESGEKEISRRADVGSVHLMKKWHNLHYWCNAGGIANLGLDLVFTHTESRTQKCQAVLGGTVKQRPKIMYSVLCRRSHRHYFCRRLQMA